MKLPDGYEPHELPVDYTGKLFTETQMMECCGKWQPIETAPKDREIDLWGCGQRTADCQWHNGEWCHYGIDEFGRWSLLPIGYGVTHWMFCPDAPKDEVSG